MLQIGENLFPNESPNSWACTFRLPPSKLQPFKLKEALWSRPPIVCNNLNPIFQCMCTHTYKVKQVQNWSTFGARTSHGQTRTHKAHHGPDLGEATTFPVIVFFVPSHGTNTQMSFCPKTPKWESRNFQNWASYDFGSP